MCELEGPLEPLEWVLLRAGAFCWVPPTSVTYTCALYHVALTRKVHSVATRSCVCALTPSRAAVHFPLCDRMQLPWLSCPGAPPWGKGHSPDTSHFDPIPLLAPGRRL